uniref:Uncharacterized protein n=1 Tax=Pseudictyota dubia TaxID=2749911 RepID=A0A7R9ZHG1_9STRA|mmetsp:Transcript_6442/g.11199  ORF Transcript_6442/g.11199 Transcript_6442/m.11199 type:complete len:622 (+) Transcript_6442:207-2072(+)
MYDLPFNFEEYIEHRELIVRGFERLVTKHAAKRRSRGSAAVAKGAVNTTGGGAAVAGVGASLVAADAAATAAAASCAATAASATTTAVAAAATASAAAIAAPVVLGVGTAMGIGIMVGKYFVDMADKAQLSQLILCLQELQKMDVIINEKITDIQKSASMGNEKSGGLITLAMTPWEVGQAANTAMAIKGEVQEGVSALKAVGDGNVTASDLDMVYKAVGEGIPGLVEQGTAAAVGVAGGFGIFGIGCGIWDMTSGIKNIRNESDFEKKFVKYVEALQAQCQLIRQHETSFRSNRGKRGRLTYINGGGGCARQMLVSYRTVENEKMAIESNSVVSLPEGAHDVKVRFCVTGGSMAWQVDRHDPKQPWTEPCKAEIIKIPKADGVDVVFELHGTSQHSYVHKAWDFSKSASCSSPRENWEWCGDEKDRESLLLCAKDCWTQNVRELSPSDHQATHTSLLRHKSSFSSKGTNLGRLTYINGGGGCARQMVVSYDSVQNEGVEVISVEVISDSTHIVILPEGAHDVRVRFRVIGGSMVRKIDRHDPKQPWTRPSEIEEICIPNVDGVDVVFELRGTSLHSYVHKAWNFGSIGSARHEWEWCGDEHDEEYLFSCAKNFWTESVAS